MELASHNSWSYLKPRKWWMKLLAFTARCQDVDIETQYKNFNVRCFDLRVKFEEGEPVVVHNIIKYDYCPEELMWDLAWLNGKRDAAVRTLLDIRNEEEYTPEQRGLFVDFCYDLEKNYPHIKFWCGKGMYDQDTLYRFKYSPTCEEKYSSVCSPRWIDDWWPRLYAKKNTRRLWERGSDKQYLMLDFVNYCKEA